MAATQEFFALQEAVAGRYSIVRELGRGGMGVVFLARDARLDRPVAIKMLPLDLAASRAHRERFVREAQTAARLSHPHIVPIHAVEEHANAVFFVMGFVDGETLGARVAREGPLPDAEAARIVQEVAWALAHAHASGIIHRDVKPDNILLERGSGRVLVTDFGIARRGDPATDLSSTEGRVVGTPRFMSPEQAAGDAIDGRSDLYSLGAVAFHAVTGRAPFEGESAVSIMAKHVTAPPPRVAELRPDLPAVLADAIDRCLAKAPTARFASAEDLAVTLRSMGHQVSELPAPVRTLTREVDSAATQLASLLTMGAVVLAWEVYDRLFGDRSFFFDIGIGITLGFIGVVFGLIVIRLAQFMGVIRDAVKAGYGHSAVSSGLLMEAQSSATPTVPRKSHVYDTLLFIAFTGLWIWLGSRELVPWYIHVPGILASPAIYVNRLTRAPGKKGNWLSRLIRGKFGKMAIRLAALGLKERPALKPAAGEPTAVALGGAVADLFAALPEAQRRQLAELPSLIDRLQAQALAIRERTSEPTQDESFVTTLAVLETLRLDLLRLHASAGTIDDLTRHLEAAKRIGEEISIQLHARADLNRTPA